MIKLVDVSKIYGDNEDKVLALDNISLCIEKGKITAITGKSGSGKSTLMNMIGALDKPTSGKVFYDEDDLTSLNEKELASYRNKKTGFIFQSFFLEPSFTVLENICMPLTIAGVDKNIREEKGKNLLDQFGLADKTYKKAKELSGGQKQRVCIIRALMNDPEVILADEPTGNLDSENGTIVLNCLREIANSGKTVILVTHNYSDAEKYADVIVEIMDGKIIEK